MVVNGPAAWSRAQCQNTKTKDDAGVLLGRCKNVNGREVEVVLALGQLFLPLCLDNQSTLEGLSFDKEGFPW